MNALIRHVGNQLSSIIWGGHMVLLFSVVTSLNVLLKTTCMHSIIGLQVWVHIKNPHVYHKKGASHGVNNASCLPCRYGTWILWCPEVLVSSGLHEAKGARSLRQQLHWEERGKSKKIDVIWIKFHSTTSSSEWSGRARCRPEESGTDRPQLRWCLQMNVSACVRVSVCSYWKSGFLTPRRVIVIRHTEATLSEAF